MAETRYGKGPGGRGRQADAGARARSGRATRPHVLVALDDETEAYVRMEADSADEAIEKVENALAASGVSGFRVTGSARLMQR
jgi:hypothetical protein